MFSPLSIVFFLCFQGNSCLLANITGKRMYGFSWTFRKRLDIRQGTIWNIFGILRLTPWIRGWFFFYFLDPCLLVMLCENGQRIFMKFSWNVNDDPWNNHDWLDCFTAPYIGAAACLLATLRQNGWVDFHEIFRIGWLWHKEQSFWGCSF